MDELDLVVYNYIKQSNEPLSAYEIAKGLNYAWGSVITRVLRLQIEHKIEVVKIQQKKRVVVKYKSIE